MIQQHISFTPDDDVEDQNHENIFSDFSTVFSSFQSPSRPNYSCRNDANEPTPDKGCCFSSSDFDWCLDSPPESKARHIEKDLNDGRLFMPPIESQMSSSHIGASSCYAGEDSQQLMMRRDDYPSFHSSQHLSAAAPHYDVANVVVTNNNYSTASLRQDFNITNTASSRKDTLEDDAAANKYSELLQAQAQCFYMFQQQQRQRHQQQALTCPADAPLSNRDVLSLPTSVHNVPAPVMRCFGVVDQSTQHGFFGNQRGNVQVDQVQGGMFNQNCDQNQFNNGESIFNSGKESNAFGPSSPDFFHLNNHQGQLQVDPVHSGIQPQFDRESKQEQDVSVIDQNQLICNGVTSNTAEESKLPNHPTRLSIPSDEQFLEPIYSFLRSACIEIFVVDHNHDSRRGRGSSKARVLGQIGLRCVHCKHVHRSYRAKQAVSYPSKTSNIFESLRNYQRFHFNACNYIPPELKLRYRELVSKKCRKVHLKYIKVYFAEAARELGMVQTSNGLFFDAPPNTSGTPSEKLQAIMSIAAKPSASDHDQRLKDLVFPEVDELIKNGKFSHIASESTREVIANCRKKKTTFVYPSDFPTLSDFKFVLYHQFIPCRPPLTALSRRKNKPVKWDTLSGLCCRHCTTAKAKGMYFPLDFESLNDSSFFNNLTCHMSTCQHIPSNIKDALNELQRLGMEHGVITKRGSKKCFLKKLWGRMESCFPPPEEEEF